MAFIPDDAEDRFNELSPSAERFYIYLCKKRSHKLGVSFGTIDECAAKYDWKRATKFAVVKELTSKGWIQSDGYAWQLTVGDFSPMEKSKNLDSQNKQSKNLDSKSKNSDSQSKKLDEKSKNLDSHIRIVPVLPEDKPERTKNIVEATKSRKTSDLTDSQKQDFNAGMIFLKSKIGIYPDGAAQGKALKWMITHGADIVQIKKGLERQLAEFQGRFRASYLSLQKVIFQWIEDGNGEIKNGSSQKYSTNGKPTNADTLRKSADYFNNSENFA